MFNIEYVGYIATFLGTISLLPQIHHIHKTKHTKGLSYNWLIVAFLGSFLWVIYASHKEINIVFLSSAIYVLLYSVIIYLKYSYEKNLM